jgi:hypothetical protein
VAADHAARLTAVVEQLDELTGRLERNRDSRCVFTYAYAIMTRRIRDDLSIRSEVDAVWMSR